MKSQGWLALAVVLCGCGVQVESEDVGEASDAIVGGPCVTRVECDDGNECTNDICNDGTCESIPWDTAWPCALGTCVAGVCMAPQPGDECVTRMDCAFVECTVPVCDNGYCLYYAGTDYQACGAGSVCIGGSCAVCLSNTDCDDGNECTENVCSGGQCLTSRVENGATCENTGACVAGLCCHGCALNGIACVSDCPAGMICNNDGVCAP